MHISTAVIPVAGAGSREFPVTTAIEKCLMPVYAGSNSRPLIDFMVQDCIKAGITRIIFITTERGRQQLSDYYGSELPQTTQELLRVVGKDSLIEAERQRRSNNGVQFEYLIQPTNVYGTTVPLYTAKQALQGESHFALMGGDDFVYQPDGTSELALAIADWETNGTDHVIMGLPMGREQATKFGVLHTTPDGRLTHFDEKPPLERVPEQPVANISRYLFSSAIWEQVDLEMQTERGTAEHYITYPIVTALAANQSFFMHRIQGKYLDGGNFEGLLEASNYITTNPPLSQS